MADRTAGLSAEFAASFKAFLDEAVAQTPQKRGVFLERLRALFGAEPMGLPVVGEQLDAPEHPNVQRAIDAYLAEGGRRSEVLGVLAGPHGPSSLAGFLGQREHAPQPGPVEYVNVGIEGEVSPCIQSGLYLITGPDEPLAVLVKGPDEAGLRPKVHIEVMAARRAAAEAFLADLRRRMRERSIYRGRVLSLFADETRSLRVKFHHLAAVDRSAIILPDGLLERIERQTMRFSGHGDRLRALGRHMKRGRLLYGPPGNGKTLVTRYVTSAMPGRTVVLLTGKAMGLISESCALARALQPATIVLEDVDLIAAERTRQDPGCNTLLFELLNEMDGIDDDADIAFILTTNRPDILDPGLASRPGRVDQAIEIPPPDGSCPRRLFDLYGRGMP